MLIVRLCSYCAPGYQVSVDKESFVRQLTCDNKVNAAYTVIYIQTMFAANTLC